MTERVTYVGKDLEAMSFAENYHRWILQIFGPYLGKRLVEVGAGNGAMSELLLEHDVESLALVEPAREMFDMLEARTENFNVATRIETYNDVFANVAAQIKENTNPDSIIYVNVLEHIEDDAAELEIIRTFLPNGGRVFIFVPALSWLYSNLDRDIGHFRRYSKKELESKCEGAGFKIVKSGYFDLFGILPWWVKYRLFKSAKLERGAVKFYDRLVVPGIKVAESALRPPIGKNIFLIAEKSQ
jgi:SAM-dependent methyltransferase